ncbi:MAG: ATP-binding protein [Sphingomonadaceae bacterium]|jgi:signal transduction histidine kinase
MNDYSAGMSEDGTHLTERVDRLLPLAIGLSLVAAIIALLYFAGTAAHEQEQALKRQQRSYEIVSLAHQLDASVAKAESQLGRYVISMDKDIGRQYQAEWDRAAQELATLQRVTSNDRVEAQLVDQLSAAFRERGAALSDIALRTTYDQKETSLGKFYLASKAQSLKRINALLDQVIEEENTRLDERNVDVARAGDSVQQVTTTYRLVGLALLIALLLMAWVARAMMKERRQEQQLIDEEYQRALALEAAVASRTEELRLAYAKLQRETEDRAKVEESLRQMQKMEAVGQLTGGIAHDFNNMLAVVVGGLELARRRVADSPDTVRHLDNALEGANRAAALTRRLLAFARAEPHMPEAQTPDAVIAGMVDLVDRAIGDQIHVELDLDGGDWSVFADRHQLENGLLNLAVNARDAMEGRGKLVFRTRQSRLRAGEIGDSPAGEYICLSVIDTGCGMTAEVLERVFEPFFTTKPHGKGTGLGLSQVFGMVRQCGGEIQIVSEPDEGTEVRLYLPRHIQTASASDQENPTGKPTEADSSNSSQQHSALTLLVVEDDPRVLAQTRSALAELGHKAICCDHPAKAIAMLRENPDIDIILSDVLMPDMTGPEMIAALPDEFKSIPVMFVTGYAGDVQDSRMFEGHFLLRKPYTLAALEKMIAQAAFSRLPGLQSDVAPAG